MQTIKIYIEIEQNVKKADVPTTATEDFKINFTDPEPYLITDSLVDVPGIEITGESITDISTDETQDAYSRSFSYHVEMLAPSSEALTRFLEEDGVFADGELDAGGFARHFLGDWEGVFLDNFSMDFDSEISGSINHLP